MEAQLANVDKSRAPLIGADSASKWRGLMEKWTNKVDEVRFPVIDFLSLLIVFSANGESTRGEFLHNTV